MSASEQDTQPPEEHGPSVTREKIFHYPAHFLAPNWNRKPGLEDTIWKLVKHLIVFSSRIPCLDISTSPQLPSEAPLILTLD